VKANRNRNPTHPFGGMDHPAAGFKLAAIFFAGTVSVQPSEKSISRKDAIRGHIADVPGLIKKKIDTAVSFGAYHNALFSIPPAV